MLFGFILRHSYVICLCLFICIYLRYFFFFRASR